MCGVVGIIGKDQKNRMMSTEIFDMCHMQKHRGPDDEGAVALDLCNSLVKSISQDECIECKAILGFDRLSIQDLSKSGHQPMKNESGNVSIVFNGEIYNFKELRGKLIERGCKFTSGTDTEVILHMYLEFGIDKTLCELNGMFSFIIADMRINKLFIARDRFGIKPLYFANTSDAVLIASELKSFLPYHGFKAEIDNEALEEYILFKSMLSNTMLKGVTQVEPGTVITFDLKSNEMVVSRFFDLDSYEREPRNFSFKKLKGDIQDTLDEVVQRQVISDAKVGCQLSGGIDSSILMNRVAINHNLLDTVSCKVDCECQADGPYIDIVNKNLNARMHIGNLDANYFIENLVDVVWHFENALSHTPAVGMYQISKIAQDNDIKVLLSGEGADELLGGYTCFSNISFMNKTPTIQNLIDAAVFRDGKPNQHAIKQILPAIEFEKYYQERIDVLSGFSGSNFDKQVKYEFYTQLRELLYRQDKMAMAHSIENRVPYLDNKMVELAWQIPEEYLMNQKCKEGKYILKDIAADLYGDEFAYRKKVGFFIPGNMFMTSNMNFINNVLKNMKNRDIVNCDILEQWAKNDLGTIGGLNKHNSAIFFKLFTFELWCQMFIDGMSIEKCKEYNGLRG